MARRWLVFMVLLAGMGVAAWFVTRAPREAGEGPPPEDSVDTGFKTARVFFASPGGDSLVVETREQIETTNFHDRVASLVEELDRGPRGRGLRTIPAGTTVLHAYIDDRGLLTLDVSAAFRDGFHGGAAAEYLAIASLARTLTANIPEVKRLMLVCGGQPLPTLAGHLPLDRPIEPAEWP